MSIQYMIDENGKRVGVVLPVEEYERVLEELEELEDIRAADEARQEIKNGEDELVSWEQAKKRIEEERSRAKRSGLVWAASKEEGREEHGPTSGRSLRAGDAYDGQPR